MTEDRIARLLGVAPDSPHLAQALIHPSYRNERGSERDNQRLEFLGDAVLGFCVTDLIYERFADADEGQLTRMRARLVNSDALARWGREHRLSEALLLGRGAAGDGLADSTNVLADAVEALIAAAYLDGGLEVARSACHKVVARELERLESGDSRDPKSELQERVQALGRTPPTYQTEQTGGPAHERWFVVGVYLAGQRIAEGRGRSKRMAERAAAASALESGAWRASLDDAAAGETETQS